MLYITLEKCHFSINEVYFLSYIVLLSEIQIEPKRINNIKN